METTETAGVKKEAGKKRHVPGAANIGFGLALITVSLAVISGIGTGKGWWDYRIGLMILKAGGYGCIAAAAISFIGVIWAGFSGSRLGFTMSLIALVTSLAVVGTLWYWDGRMKTSPLIHDVSTDTDNPPQFRAIVPLRTGSPNPLEYGGHEIAVRQRAAYPGLAPAILPEPPNEAFRRSLNAAVGMGWEIVEASQADGRIEATDTTFWFGFRDDIVIRIIPHEKGSRVDVRSSSRVGKGDAGTNAKRIQGFLKKIKG